MIESEKYQRYMSALNEAAELIDQARLRASEVKGIAAGSGEEDAIKMHLTVNGALDLESKNIQIGIMDIHKKLYRIKFKEIKK